MSAPSAASYNPEKITTRSPRQKTAPGLKSSVEFDDKTDPHIQPFHIVDDTPLDPETAHRRWSGEAERKVDLTPPERSSYVARDPKAEKKITEIHEALARMEHLPGQDQALATRYEQLLRDQVPLEHRLQARLKALGLSQDSFTRVVQDPSSIGWVNRGKELFKRTVDRSYRSIDQLASEYRQMSRALHEIKQDWEKVMQRETPEQKKLQASEKVAVEQLYSKEQAAMANAQWMIERIPASPVGAVPFAARLHTKVLESAERVASGAKQYRSVLTSAGYKALEAAQYEVEKQVDQYRIAAQRTLQEVCFEQRQAEALLDKERADALRKEAMALVREQQPLYEDVQGLNDRLFIERMQQDVIPFHPVFQTLFEALTTEGMSASQLRQGKLFMDLSVEDRALAERYLRTFQAREKLMTSRYTYHREAAGIHQKEAWMEEGILMQPSPENQKKLDADRVQVLGLLSKAYPTGRVYRFGSSLKEALIQETQLPSTGPDMAAAFMSAQVFEDRLSLKSDIKDLQQFCEAASKAMKQFVAADGPEAYKAQANALRTELHAAERQLADALQAFEAAEETRRVFEIPFLQAETNKWIKTRVASMQNWIDKDMATSLKEWLETDAEAFWKEELLQQPSQGDAAKWQKAAERAVEEKLALLIPYYYTHLFNAEFVQQPSDIQRTQREGVVTGKFLSSYEAKNLEEALKQHPEEVMSYLPLLGQYAKTYALHADTPKLSSETIVELKGLHNALRVLNRKIGLPMPTNTRPAYWENARHAANPEKELLSLKPEFLKRFKSFDRGIVNTLYEELKRTIRLEGLSLVTEEDEKGLSRMLTILTHPDITGNLSKDRTRLEGRYNKAIQKLSFAKDLDDTVKEQLLGTIQAVLSSHHSK